MSDVRGLPEAPASTLCACGFTAASPAPRCKACPQPAAASPMQAAAPAFGAGVPVRAGTPRPPTAAPVRQSRWAKSDVSHGPAGRIIWTVLLLLPLVVFGFTLASGVGIVGAGIWLFVVLPVGLRHTWKKTPVRRT